MTLQVNRVLVRRRDREDVNFITVANLKSTQLLRDSIRIARRRKIQTQHGALFMRLQALYFDVPQSSSRQDPAGQVEHLCQRLFSVKFINGWPAYHPIHRDLRSNRGHEESVTVVQAHQVGMHAMQQQIVGVHFLDELFAAVMFERSQRTSCCDPTRLEQGVQRC